MDESAKVMYQGASLQTPLPAATGLPREIADHVAPAYFDNGGWMYRPVEATPSDIGSVAPGRAAAVDQLLIRTAEMQHGRALESWDQSYADGVILDEP